jgi:hypothetical protein
MKKPSLLDMSLNPFRPLRPCYSAIAETIVGSHLMADPESGF